MAAELSAPSLLADLARHCRVGASTPFAPGPMDCCSWVADWVLARTGRDPMAAWRGRYRTRRGFVRLMRRNGGMAEMVGQGMAAIGAARIDPSQAVPGDVGLIVTVAPTGEVESSAAIRGQLGWLAKLSDGLWRAPSAIAAWRVG